MALYYPEANLEDKAALLGALTDNLSLYQGCVFLNRWMLQLLLCAFGTSNDLPHLSS
jgi:hypothetical protein